MKYLSKYVVPLLLCILLTPGCKKNDFFALERPPQFPWKNVQEFEFAATSPYHKFFYGNGGGGWDTPYGALLTLSAYQADYFRWFGNPEGYPADQVYNRKYTERVDQAESRFKDFYEMIGLCNNGLDFFKKNNDNPFPLTTAEDKEKNVMRIKGELLFNRALAYYSLVNIFCPAFVSGQNDLAILPLRTSVATTKEQAMDKKPVATSKIYDLIVADLKEAKTLLPEKYDAKMHVSYKSEGRANKFAAAALLSKVYLSMGKLTGSESALSELDLVLNSTSQGYGLETDPFTAFNNSSQYPDSKEVVMWGFYADPIWANSNHPAFRMMMFNKGNRNAIDGGRGTGRSWSLVSYFQLSMSNTALKQLGWMNNDLTESNSAKADKRYNSLFYRFEGYRAATAADNQRSGATNDGKYTTFSKYNNGAPFVMLDKYYKTALGRLQNLPFIRIADLLLTRAILNQRSGSQSAADADFNLVASRSWDAVLAGSAYNPKMAVTVDDINNERIKELAGEDLWYNNYLMALKLPLKPGDRTGPAIVFPYTDVYWKNSIPLGETDF